MTPGDHELMRVLAGRTTNAVLELGPRYATLKLVIMNEQGNPMGASLTFIRIDDPTHPYGRVELLEIPS